MGSLCPLHASTPYSATHFVDKWKGKQQTMQSEEMRLSDPQCMGCDGMSDEENFLLCDNDKFEKPHGCHIYCLDPPLDAVPDNEWYCPKCDGSKHINARCVYCFSQMY